MGDLPVVGLDKESVSSFRTDGRYSFTGPLMFLWVEMAVPFVKYKQFVGRNKLVRDGPPIDSFTANKTLSRSKSDPIQ